MRLPLILMNSEATREPTLEALARFPELATPEIPPDFLQSMVPKLDAEIAAAGPLAGSSRARMVSARAR